MPNTAKITLTSNQPGASLFMLGNEAIARGAIEAGVRLVAAYPGTPSTEIVETLMNHRSELDMYVEWSVNEKVAFGSAFGASLCGARALAVMKHVGVNVALDSILTAAYIGAKGGLVLVEAEDPGQWSSQNEQDNRYLAEEGYLPILEPSSAQEAKDMLVEAFRLSEEFKQPIIVRSVTRIGHSRSDIKLGKIQITPKTYTLEKDPASHVLLPAIARKHRGLMVARLQRIQEAVDNWSFNRSDIKPQAKSGIIACGICYSYVLETLRWLKLENIISVLKIGTPYPMPRKLVENFLQVHSEILVVEELEPYLENHIKALAQEQSIPVKIHGKDVLPLIGEYTIRKVTEAICRLTGTPAPLDFSQIDARVKEAEEILPLRPPALCAGCPHRASQYIIKSVCDQIKRETGVDPIRPGDIGCNCLGAQPPLNAVDISTCMGGGYDLSNGIARVIAAPVVAHLGDSTFFHSGMAPLVNAVYNKTKITMIVLDNLTTAMTGSQPSPSAGNDLIEEPLIPIRPEDVARGCGIQYIKVIDPQQDLKESMTTLRKAIEFPGPSFVVFRRACAIIEQREKKARGEKIKSCEIQTEKCIAQSDPYCTAACPLHVDARGYVKLVKEGRFDDALNLIQEKLPFAGIVGRICTHPCQTRCKRSEVDQAIEIMALKRTAADLGHSSNADLAVTDEKPQKIAVVGGGPAGLMAAFELRKNGYRVTIFEAANELGGLLTQAIPEYRLPLAVAHNEIQRILPMGIEVKLNTRVGKDIGMDDLKKKFDAVFLATGAHRSTPLTFDGKVLPGAIDGLEFLKTVRLGQPASTDKQVIVIGGGNAAVDCARTCLRLGARDVSLVYRRDREQMPAITKEIEEAEKEGIKLILLTAPIAILEEKGKIEGMECVRMALGQPDASGRSRPEAVPNSNFILKAGTFISAIGQAPDLSYINEQNMISKEGLLQANPVTLATNLPGVFAGGDAVSGPASVIEALADGRQAAISIDSYLNNLPLETERPGTSSQSSPLKVETEEIPPCKAISIPQTPLASRQEMREVETGYTPEMAASEAGRCLSCGCQVCVQKTGCPAFTVNSLEIDIDASQCPGCGLCAQLCPVEAIKYYQ